MSKKIVYAHKTGAKLNTEAIRALSGELSKEEKKIAVENDYLHMGYFTKENGEGTKVKSVMAAGNGIYYDRSKLNDDEIAEVKADNFTRLSRKRMTKTVLSIRGLINTANKAIYKWSDEQADKIIDTLTAELSQLENKLRDVREEKEGKTGYNFDF